MKHWLRNLCALMLMLTVMISAVSVPRAAYASEDEFQNAVSKLRTLGILDAQTAGELKAGDPMTRAAFIALCVQSMGMENAAASHSGKTAFSDVPDIHPYAGYLQTAYTMGLVSGDGERVYPDDKIKNGEAMKILVTMTGAPYSAFRGKRQFGAVCIAGVVAGHYARRGEYRPSGGGHIRGPAYHAV